MSEPTPDPAGESELLRRLLARALAPTGPPWDDPPPGLLRGAAAAYLLLDRRPGLDAESFVLATLEPLVRDMSRATERRTVADRQHVRGRVLWGATMAARAAHGEEHGPYVYRELRRQYDTPENQLLRLLVEQLDEALRLVPAPLRDGLCFQPAAAGAPTPARPRLARIESILRRVRANPRLRAITLPERVEAAHLLRAETARDEGYGLAARLFRRYADLAAPAGWREALATTGRRVLLLPRPADGPGEPWMALAALALREGVRRAEA